MELPTSSPSNEAQEHGAVARLAGAAAAVGRTRDLGEVCAAVLDQAAALGGHCAYLHLRDEDGALRLHSARGLPDPLRAALQQFSLGAPLVAARAARSREVQVVKSPDELSDELSTARALLELTGSAGMVALPLLCGNELVGVLTWTVRRRGGPELERVALEALASVLALALSRARPREKVEARLLRPLPARRRAPIPVQLQTLLDYTSSPLALLQADGAVVQLNRRAAGLLDAGPELDGKPIWNARALREGDRAAELRSAVLRAAQGQATSAPLRLRDEQGRELVFSFNVRPVAERAGRVGLLLLEGHDLRSTPELERLYGEWIALVAHDLRQPLNSLAIWQQLLERAAEGSEVDLEEPRRQAASSLAQLERLTGDLLEVARLDAGRLRLELRSLDVAELLREVLPRCGPPERLQLQLGPQLPRIKGDAERMEQILVNLTSNALKYGTQGSPVRVRASRDGDAVRFSVTNDGPGIAAEILPGLFQRFFRAHREGWADGTGLGLYIVHSLVEAHGGRIWAESLPNEETTFHFTLPFTANLEVVR